MRKVLCLLAALAATPAYPSSEDAWQDFRAAVKATCTALIAPPGPTFVEISPFGSESFGAAIVTTLRDGYMERNLCIFDKVTQKAELAALPEIVDATATAP